MGGLLKAHQNNPDFTQNLNSYLGNFRAHAYDDASVSFLKFTKSRGLEAQISFLQSRHLQKKSSSDRQRWWKESGRLEEGSLLCFLSFEGRSSSLLFFSVSEKITDPNKPHGLASRGSRATITAKLASGYDETQWESLVKMSFPQDTRNFVIEFPGIIPATFIPVLENIQQMQKMGRLPFEKWIVPKLTTGNASKSAEFRVPPPLYARVAGFTFNLKPILNDPTVVLALNPGSDDENIPQTLEHLTPLDRGQCEAMVSALTHEFALIQGPPGTGKSYLGVRIMRVLIENKSVARLGPIVVV